MLEGTMPVELLHPVETIRAVYSYSSSGSRVDYAQGADWTVSAGRIARTPGSKLPDFSTHQFVKRDDGRFDHAPDPNRNPPLTIFYNVYIDYASRVADRTVTAKPLSRSTMRVLCLGDSIAAGGHTIANFFSDTDEQSWCGLLRARLAGSATVDNPSVPGAALQGAGPQIEAAIADPPDAVILAFGMNDHTAGAEALPAFRTRLADAVDRLKARGIGVLLVGFFERNPLWAVEDPEQSRAYNAAIREVANSRNVPFADTAEAFVRATSHPNPHHHLTADFIHHPNVYGQRIYFSVIVPYFLERDTLASLIPGYVLGPWTN